ncbi:MAG: DUF2769 domain-containing protein [Alphaproteobacteria bacterium]|nr:DUF2769 domain-containing protein [Alphaproteobacteria bacterium]
MQTVARTKENLKKCRCNDCPSYTLGCKIKNYPVNLWRMMEGMDNLEHFEGMFCAYGTSNCIEEDKGCLCEDCEVFHENKLNRSEYCLQSKNDACCSCGNCPAN